MKHSFTADRKLIQSLKKRSNPVDFGNGRTLFRQDDPPTGVYILLEGEAFLEMKSETGKVLIALQVPAPAVLGLPGLIANEPYTFSAQACEGADVRFVAQNDFDEVIQSEATLYPQILRILAAEVRSVRLALPGLLGKQSTRAHQT